MQTTEGGIIPLVALLALALIGTSCAVNNDITINVSINVQTGGDNSNSQGDSTSAEWRKNLPGYLH